MKVFMPGASGYIGSVIAEKLVASGHVVLGLARSPRAAETMRSRGVEPHSGSFQDVMSLVAGVRASDAVISTATTGSVGHDQVALSVMLDVAEGSGKPFLFTSAAGTLGVLSTGAASERIPGRSDAVSGGLRTFPAGSPLPESTCTDFLAVVADRVRMEKAVVGAAVRGVRSVVIRPGMVYGRAGGIDVLRLIRTGRRFGVIPHVEDGDGVRSTVHVDDLADLYLLALARANAGDLFTVASGEVNGRELAESVARLLCLRGRVEKWTVAQAWCEWGPTSLTVAIDSRMAASKARQTLGWRPTRPGVLDEVERGSYLSLATDSAPVNADFGCAQGDNHALPANQ